MNWTWTCIYSIGLLKPIQLFKTGHIPTNLYMGGTVVHLIVGVNNVTAMEAIWGAKTHQHSDWMTQKPIGQPLTESSLPTEANCLHIVHSFTV